MLKITTDAKIPISHLGYGLLNTFRAKNSCITRIVRLIGLLIFMPLRLMLAVVATHIVVLPMNSGFSVLFEIALAKLLGRKIIVDYYISSYDTAVNDWKTVKKDTLRAKWLKWKDRYLIKSADKVIFLNASERTYYLSIAGLEVDPSKVAIVPLCVEYKMRTFQAYSSRQAGSNPEDKTLFNVCWWGTYIPLHGIENLIKAISLSTNKKIVLHLFGNSDSSVMPYRKLVHELGLSEQVVFDNERSFVNGELEPWLIKNCDLALGVFGASDKAHTVLPNKIVDSLAMALPCLTVKTKAIEELLDGYGCLYYCGESPQEIAGALDLLSQKVGLETVISERGFEAYLELFSPDVFRRNFLNVLQSV